MNRAYSLLTVKEMDDDKRIIRGIATTPTPDRMDDIVEPKGAEFKLPIPLLWQHDSRQPIGHVNKAVVTDAGIEIEAHLVRIDEAGKLKDRLDEAWQSIKTGLVGALSIGFQSIEYSRIDGSYGLRYLRWLWLELSAVTIPANGDATITSIKALDAQQRAATGKCARIVRLDAPARDRAQPFVIRKIR
jgi:HK97 family phage prohead protease